MPLSNTSNTSDNADQQTASTTEDERKAVVPWMRSCRLMMGILGLFGTVNLYMMRADMSIAIVCMTNYTSANTSLIYNETLSRPTLRFNWSYELRGWVLSSFSIGNVITQFPGGWLSSRFGAKIVLGTAIFSLSVLSLLTPISAQINVYLLMVVEVSKGLASGVWFPSYYQLLGRWTTLHDRSFILAVMSAGGALGSMLSFTLSGFLCDYGFANGWPSIFYLFGLFGLVWCIAWYRAGFSSPSEHPRISSPELKYIYSLNPHSTEQKQLKPPWNAMFTSRPFYAIFVMELCEGWNWYVALTTLPQFVQEVLGFNIAQNGLSNALPYVSNIIVNILGSLLADVILTKGWLSTTLVRKIFQTLGTLPSALFSMGLVFVPAGQSGLAVLLIALWIGLLGFQYSGKNCNIIDIAPQYSGYVKGILNTVPVIPGVIAPVVVAKMTSLGTQSEWQQVFIMNSVILLLGLLVYDLFTDAEVQMWAKVKQCQPSQGQSSLDQISQGQPSHGRPSQVQSPPAAGLPPQGQPPQGQPPQGQPPQGQPPQGQPPQGQSSQGQKFYIPNGGHQHYQTFTAGISNNIGNQRN